MKREIEIENRIIHLRNFIDQIHQEELTLSEERAIIKIYKNEIKILEWVLSR